MTNAKLTRRDALRQTAWGAGSLWLGGFPTSVVAKDDVDRVAELAQRFRTTPTAEVFPVASEAVAAGADHQTLLSAVFVAGVHDIRPRPVGSKLHAVMMIESALQLAESVSSTNALQAAFWSLHNYKQNQQRDIDEGDWELPAPPKVAGQGDGAEQQFHQALADWDADKADRAVVGLLKHRPVEAIFELIWPYAARTFVDVGHKIIYAVQVERVLRRMGWSHSEPALRALINGIVYPGEGTPDTTAYDQSRELLCEFPPHWLDGKDDPSQVLALVRSFAQSNSAEAARLVVSALQDGLGPTTIWDALRLHATEIFFQRPAAALRRHLPVHPVTELNAFGYAWRRTTRDETKRLLLLQAAAWLPLWQAIFREQYGSVDSTRSLAELGMEVDPEGLTIDQVLRQREPSDVRAFLDCRETHPSAYVTALQQQLFRSAQQDHQYKYLAAITEEASLVRSEWASRILAPAITYLPASDEEESEVSRRAAHAIRQAGIR